MLSLFCGVFEWKLVCAGLFIFPLEIQLGRGGIRISLTGLKPENVVCLSQAMIWITIGILLCSGLFNVQWFEMKGSCSFWWYRWNGCGQCKINTAYVIHVQRTPSPFAIMLFNKENGKNMETVVPPVVWWWDLSSTHSISCTSPLKFRVSFPPMSMCIRYNFDKVCL